LQWAINGSAKNCVCGCASSHTHTQLALFRLSGAHFFAREDWQIQTLGRRRVLLQCASCKTPLGVQTIFVLCSTPFARPSAFGMISLCAGGGE